MKENNSKQLELIKPLLIFLLFCLTLFIGLSVFNFLNKIRQEHIYKKHAEIIQIYIDKNRPELFSLFEFTEKEIQKCLDENKESNGYINNCYGTVQIERAVRANTMHNQNWHDFSYLIKNRQTGILYVVNISGGVSRFNYSNTKTDIVNSLLSGGVTSIPLDDYVYNIAGKEVIIPFKNQSGEILGAVIYSVWEEN